jgi:RNA polymerase sigma factor (TIGR02999 family)
VTGCGDEPHAIVATQRAETIPAGKALCVIAWSPGVAGHRALREKRQKAVIAPLSDLRECAKTGESRGDSMDFGKSPPLALGGPTAKIEPGLDQMYSLAYEELRRLASTLRRGASITLSPTTLVNEAWLKLAASRGFAVESKLHFKRIAARAMRQVIVEAARRKSARKRGGDVSLVTFDEALVPAASTSLDVLALEVALDELEQLKPRQARVVEYRFFGGFNVVETAELLEVAEITVHREWRLAKAWLARRLSRPA